MQANQLMTREESWIQPPATQYELMDNGGPRQMNKTSALISSDELWRLAASELVTKRRFADYSHEELAALYDSVADEDVAIANLGMESYGAVLLDEEKSR